MVGAVLELSSSWVSSALSAPLQKPLFPVISMLTWNTKFRVNLPKFGPKTGPVPKKLVPKKDSKRGQNGSFNSGLLFGPNSGPNLGSNSGPNFGPNSGSRFWSQFWADFGSKSNSFCGFWGAVGHLGFKSPKPRSGFWLPNWAQMVGQELQKKPGQAQRWFQKRWETILRGQRCFETPCRYPIRHARVTLREA